MSIKQGEYLKKLRTEKGLSQDALGEVLGISRQSVSKWEQGNSTPDIDNIGKLAEFYGVSIDSLVKGEAQEEAENATAESEEEKAVNELIDEFTGKAENEEKEEQQETQLSAPQPSVPVSRHPMPFVLPRSIINKYRGPGHPRSQGLPAPERPCAASPPPPRSPGTP